MMEPRITVVTLGVESLERALAFYRDGLGWPLSTASVGNFAIFKMSTGTALALYPRKLLAEDGCINDSGGFAGITLAQNVRSKEEVDTMLSQSVVAGGTILKPAQHTDWGGYSGYFADPDGHPWEVAWAPMFEMVGGLLALPV